MAHPSFAFPTGHHLLAGDSGAARAATGDFFAIHCIADGDVTVKGPGRFEYVDIDAAVAGTVNKYINPDTSKPFANVVDGSADDEAAGKAAGFYEVISSKTQSISLAAGQTIYGAFTEVATAASASTKCLLYSK